MSSRLLPLLLMLLFTPVARAEAPLPVVNVPIPETPRYEGLPFALRVVSVVDARDADEGFDGRDLVRTDETLDSWKTRPRLEASIDTVITQIVATSFDPGDAVDTLQVHVRVEAFEVVRQTGLLHLFWPGHEVRIAMEFDIPGLSPSDDTLTVKPLESYEITHFVRTSEESYSGVLERALRDAFDRFSRSAGARWDAAHPSAPRTNVDPRNPFDPSAGQMAWRALGTGFGVALGLGYFTAGSEGPHRIHPVHYAMPIAYTIGVVGGAHIGNQQRGNYLKSLLAASAVYGTSLAYLQQDRDRARLPAYYAATVVGTFAAAMIVESLTTEDVPIAGTDARVGLTWHEGPTVTLNTRF